MMGPCRAEGGIFAKGLGLENMGHNFHVLCSTQRGETWWTSRKWQMPSEMETISLVNLMLQAWGTVACASNTMKPCVYLR